MMQVRQDAGTTRLVVVVNTQCKRTFRAFSVPFHSLLLIVIVFLKFEAMIKPSF